MPNGKRKKFFEKLKIFGGAYAPDSLWRVSLNLRVKKDKLRNEDKGLKEMSIVLFTRFFGNASKHYTTSHTFCGVPNGLNRWFCDIAARTAILS